MKVKKIFITAEYQQSVPFDTQTANTDVVVELSNGIKYIAAFFTYENIKLLIEQHRKSGEFLSGKYFQAKNMVLIDTCSRDNIHKVIQHLIEEGDFKTVFRQITHVEE